jgi:hypothetical protein
VFAVAAALAVAVAAIVAISSRGSVSALLPGIGRPAKPGDPFAYIASRRADFEARAIAGTAWVGFAKSPSGVIATAARVARYRTLIDAAAAGTGIDPNLL